MTIQVPEALIPPTAARVMSLTDGTAKVSRFKCRVLPWSFLNDLYLYIFAFCHFYVSDVEVSNIRSITN